MHVNALKARLATLSPRAYAGSLTFVLGAFLIALPINTMLDVSALGRVFLVGILVSAISFGLWPSIFASLISAVFYDLFFLPPIYSLTIHSRQDVVDLACFVVVAVITSALAARVRRYAIAADERAMTAEKFAEFCRRLANAPTLDAAMREAAELVFEHVGLPVTIVVPVPEALDVTASFPPGRLPAAPVIQAANRHWAAASRAEALAGDWRILLLSAPETEAGLLLIMTGAADLTDKQRQALGPLMFQIALAIERFSLQQRLLDIRLQRESEALRATVLTSLSHDLRAPLASIIAGASGMDLQWPNIADATKLDVVRTIRAEAERLDGFIGKLLDMTRLQHGAVIPRIERTVVAEVICSAIDQLADKLRDHTVALDVPDDLPLADADPVLLQQVLVNVLDNAAKYAPASTPIRISAGFDASSVLVHVADEGPGVHAGDLPHLFDRFYRVRPAAGAVPGSGLGLAICDGFLKIMRGTIQAANRTDRSGTVFSIALPLSIREHAEGATPL